MLLGVLSVGDRSLRCVRGRGSSAWRAAWGLRVRFGLPVAALPARGPVRACAALRRMRVRPPRSGGFAPFLPPLCYRAAPAPPFCHAAALPPPPPAPLPFICCVVPRFRCGPFAGWPFAPWLKNANGAPALPAFGPCGHNCRRGNTCVCPPRDTPERPNARGIILPRPAPVSRTFPSTFYAYFMIFLCIFAFF